MSYDIHYQGTEGADTKPITFGYTATISVRGVQKMINRWVKCLLTPRGSDPFAPAEGTGYTALIGINVADTRDLVDALNIILQDCDDQMRGWDRKNLPAADEIFGSSKLQQVIDLGGGRYDIWVLVQNAARQGRYVQLPTVG